MTENTNKTANPTPKKLISKSAAVIFALVTLFNPNVNLIDVLPDFIGYFILARVFERAADSAPYFEEAHASFVRLTWLSLAKIPGLFVIIFARSHNTNDNDIISLMSLVFAIAEIILVVMAIKNIFDALFYLGERTDAVSLIRSDAKFSADALRSFTYVFAVFKCIIYVLPEMLILTRTVENESGTASTLITGSNYYPFALISSLILGTIVGAVWLKRMICYVLSIKREGKFDEALLSLASANSESEYLVKIRRRSLFRSFNLFILGAVLTFELGFDNFYGINLLPHFLSGAVILIAIIRICAFANKKKLRRYSLAFGTCYIVSSAVAYVFSVRFLTMFGGYEALAHNNAEARAAYTPLLIASVLEVAFFVCLMISFALIMRCYIVNNLGLSPSDENYRVADKKYHNALTKNALILAVIGSLTAISKLADIILKGFSQMIFVAGADNLPTSTVIASALPWFGIVVVGASVLFCLYSMYFFSVIKDEVLGIRE